MSQSTELLLLGLLDSQSMHGYELHELLEHRLKFVSDLKKPTAYRTLERLHEQGLVDREAQRAGKRPERLVYHLTEKGRARFRQLLREELGTSGPVIYPGNAALLFADRLTPEECATLLRRRWGQVVETRRELASAAAAHAVGSPPRLVLEHDLAHVDAEIGWLEERIQELEG